MNRHEQAEECESKFKSGEISLCSIDELIVYLEAMSDFSSAIVAKYQERASHIQTLNNLISSKTLEAVNTTIVHAEDTIKDLNAKNTKLTILVIVLATLAIFLSCIQIYFTVKPRPILINLTEQVPSLQKIKPELKVNPPNKPLAKPKPEDPKNIHSPEPEPAKTESSEKELILPSNSPK